MNESNKIASVLLVQELSLQSPKLREAIDLYQERQISLQRVERWATALARLAGGGIDLVILDLTIGGSTQAGDEIVRQIVRAAAGTPVIVVCRPGDTIGPIAIQVGAADYVAANQVENLLGRTMRSALEIADRAEKTVELPMPRKKEAIISFIGAKGGVGTTTVAFNVAAALAKKGRVVLVEMRPAFGTLTQYVRPMGLTRNLSSLLKCEFGVTSPVNVSSSMWTYRTVPGMRIVFAPQTSGECTDIDFEQAKDIIQALARIADYVIVDLPASLTEANRAVIESSHLVAMVVERDPVCVRSAKLMASVIATWNGVPQPLGTVLVNRALVSAPIPLDGIDQSLGCDLLAVIPPASDICLSAQNACAPVVVHHAQSLVANCFSALADKLVSLCTFARPRQRTAVGRA